MTEARLFPIEAPESFFDFSDPLEIRFQGHRLGIEEVLLAHLDGFVQEEIAFWYPSLSAPEIQAAIQYYEQNREELDEYLRLVREHEARTRQEHRRNPSPGVRRLRAIKRKARRASVTASKPVVDL